MTEKLSNNQIKENLATLNGWEPNPKNNKINKTFIFNDFKEAFQFMSTIADFAEEINHHPEWFNVYNRLDVELTTHDANGITDLDFTMARKMNELFSS